MSRLKKGEELVRVIEQSKIVGKHNKSRSYCVKYNKKRGDKL